MNAALLSSKYYGCLCFVSSRLGWFIQRNVLGQKSEKIELGTIAVVK